MDDIIARNSYFTGTYGESYIQMLFSDWKIATNKIKESDFGEDLLCDIFASIENESSIRTNLTFRTQVKTTEDFSKSYFRKTKNGYSIQLKTSLLESWLNAYYPVVLIIWSKNDRKGYWCIPSIEIKKEDLLGFSTKSVNFTKDLLSNELLIKSSIQNYFNSIYKAKSTKYRCKIYPLWMPKYRIFTPIELREIFKESNLPENCYYDFDLPDALPSFLNSYNNLDINGLLPCLVYDGNVSSIDGYLKNMLDMLAEAELINYKGWISYIVSPIELLCEISRPINKLTDWQAFSLINGTINSDYKFNFELNRDFCLTEKVRSMSSDESYYIHKSGDFAILTYASSWNLISRKNYNYRFHDLFSRSYCMWDLTECSASEKKNFERWCESKNYNLTYYDSSAIAIISHPFFSFGNYGVLLPGAITWLEFDELNFNSNEFINQIPYGKKASKENNDTFESEFLNSNNIEEQTIQIENYVNGEVLNHSNRNIIFIAYICAIHKKYISQVLEKQKYNLQENLSNYFSEIDLYLNDEYDDNLSDLVMSIVPKYFYSTSEIVNLFLPYYEKVFYEVIEYCNYEHNMAYYIKYNLDRYLPEEFVK